MEQEYISNELQYKMRLKKEYITLSSYRIIELRV